MAHELDTNKATGRKAMFSVGATPWHGEGTILTEAPTFADAMHLAGCDYDVELRELFVKAADADLYEPTGVGRAVVRMDRGTVLGVVKERYTPLANRDAFGVLEPLLDKGVATLETGGTLRGGRDAWLMARFNIDDPVVREVFADEVIPFALITNNHAGESRCLVMETPIRVVCANTLGAAVSRMDATSAVAVAHVGDARTKVVEAAERMFVGLIDRYKSIAESYALMKSTRLTVDAFVRTVLDVASPLPPDLGTVEAEHMTTRGYDLAYAAAERRRTALREAWTGGKGHTGDHSAWEAYNGAVEVIDHDATLYRTNGSRVAALIGGRLVERKQAVLERVVSACVKAQRDHATVAV
jgi:phage/plasmid-like protein (TIGR03299 family)